MIFRLLLLNRLAIVRVTTRAPGGLAILAYQDGN
jgi:hypothetical protein